MNIICMGGRIVGPAVARDLVQTFLEAKFSQDVGPPAYPGIPGYAPNPVTPCGSALCAGSSQRGYALSHGFELANGLAAKEKRDERADRDNHENRAEEDRRRSDMRHHQKRRQHASEKPPERLAEGLPAAAQRRLSSCPSH
jgi:hypothetical protein